jgi:GT2 family glycosyltransferase
VLVSHRLPAGSAPPGANRNAAWRRVNTDLVVFTDDDCRPPPDWLERALEAAAANPGAIVQGTVEPDPDEWALERAPHRHTQVVRPPSPHAEAANIVYPREVLERHGGFDESLYTGEDTDLMVRARSAGTVYTGAERMLTYHAITPMSLPRYLWSLRRWKNMPELIRRHPELRADFPLRAFWKPSHVWLPLALAAIALGRRRRPLVLGVIPYVSWSQPRYGRSARGRLRALSELPSQVLVDATEVGILAWGSARARTFFV